MLNPKIPVDLNDQSQLPPKAVLPPDPKHPNSHKRSLSYLGVYLLRQIVVDDTDPDIRYTGPGWFLDNGSLDAFGSYGPTYLKSLHGTNVDGSLAYTFRGTAFEVIGTTMLTKAGNGTFDPSWECFIDNVSVGATKPGVLVNNNWLMCRGESLPDGKHELKVNVVATNHTFWVDRIYYTPSPGISLKNTVVLVQNQDPGVYFDSGWQKSGGTANMTRVTGSKATILFTGTSLTWVGSFPPDLSHVPSTATYSVDNGPEVPFNLKGLPASARITVYSQTFFKTPDLSPGPHSLIVKYQGTGQQTPLTLDYLYITTSIPILENSSPNLSLGSNASSATGTTTSPPSRSSKRDASPGIVVGSIFGSLGLFALLFLLFLWHKRWQRRAEFQSNSSVLTRQHPGVSPYLYEISELRPYFPDMGLKGSMNPLWNNLQPQRTVPVTPSYDPPLPPNATTVAGADNQSPPLPSRHGASTNIPPGTASGNLPSAVLETREVRVRERREQLRPPVRRVVVQYEHEDSGYRLNRQRVIHVPPTYTYD